MNGIATALALGAVGMLILAGEWFAMQKGGKR